MNSDIVQKELNLIEADKKLAYLAMEAEKEAYANRLRRGLGDEIRKGLSQGNKPIPIKMPVRYRLKKFFKRLFGVFGDPKIDDMTNMIYNVANGESEE